MQEVQREVQDEVQWVVKMPMMHQTFDGNDQHLQVKTREEMPPQPPQASSSRQIQTKMMIPKRQMDCCFVFF